MPARTYYEVLNVAKDASASDLRTAYLLLSRMFHPDRFDAAKQPAEWAKANELLRELNQAYSVLRDAEKRKAYDSMLGTALLHLVPPLRPHRRAAVTTAPTNRFARRTPEPTSGKCTQTRDRRNHSLQSPVA